ncbi:MAG: hypothetical protein KQJ78_20570 [Deltaproteobacteria bacterium]|nr:hypothetical protein [Deltaproteobacteria bacterium]
MRPTPGTTLLRPDLGALNFEYAVEASQRGFIGTTIMPYFPTALASGSYPVIPAEVFLKLPDTHRTARAGYARSDWQFSDDTYSCQEYGFEEVIDDSERNMYEGIYSELDIEAISAMRAMDILLRGQEKRIADMVFNTSNLTAHAVTTEWSTTATASPITDVRTGKEAVRKACGLEPNILVIAKAVFDNLVMCAQIAERVQYTTPVEMMDEEAQRRLLSQALGVQVRVGNAIYDAAKKGQDLSATDIWDDEYALLARVPTNPLDLKEPCLGRTFLWTGDAPQEIVTEQYRSNEVRGDVIRVRTNVGEVFVCTAAAYLMSNITA